MNELKENTDIKNLIYEVRGKQVILDSDLEVLYGCKNGTKEINQAVKNNPLKFPERYCFKLDDEESKSFLVKNFDQKIETRGGKFKNPTVFTEQGIYMLATILKTKVATEATIKIMDTFVKMRRLINENKDIFKRVIKIENKTDYIESALKKHDNKIEELFDKFERKEDLKSKLFFDGEIYDAYELIIGIIKSANKSIIIIDNYIDYSILKYLSKKKKDVRILLITSNKSKLDQFDIEKYNAQYNLLSVKYTNIFHDRFIIIDNKDLYHLGTSLNYIGSKVFAINKIDDDVILSSLLNKINDII